MDFLFVGVVICIVLHELDAIHHHEWRFFFASVPVTDETAFRIFTSLHVPALLAVLWFFENLALQRGVDLFAIVHAGIHVFFKDHPAVEFETWFSWLWIYGAALLGAVHLYSTL